MKNVLFALTLAPALFTVSNLQAQSVWSNSITGTNPNGDQPYISGQIVGDHLAVSGLGRGPGIAGTNANNRYNANSWNTSSIDLDAYFTFAFTPDSQYELDLIKLSFTGQRSNTGPTSYSFRSSLDNFTSDISTGAITGATTADPYSFDLTSFTDITGPIEFRFYGWGASSSTGTFSFNDFEFDGLVNAVTVPEPGTFGLLGLGLLGLHGLRRSRGTRYAAV